MEDFNKLMDALSQVFSKEFIDNVSTYASCIEKKWDGDKLVKDEKKEWVNGELVNELSKQNVCNDTTTDSKCSCNKKATPTTVDALAQELKDCKASNERMFNRMTELTKLNMKLQEENTILKAKLDNIKKMF